jgi:BA14K-like protein
MTKLKVFGTTFLSIALAAITPAMARGGIAAGGIFHRNSFAPAQFAGRGPQEGGFRRTGPVVVIIGGTYEDYSDAYCAQNYPTYDASSGTYLGDDGLRYACPR